MGGIERLRRKPRAPARSRDLSQCRHREIRDKG
jgi:hypothetical protein